jgi:hypothetical protein
MKVTLDMYIYFVLSDYGQNKLNTEFKNISYGAKGIFFLLPFFF